MTMPDKVWISPNDKVPPFSAYTIGVKQYTPYHRQRTWESEDAFWEDYNDQESYDSAYVGDSYYDHCLCLDGHFTPTQLRMLADWMEQNAE